MARTPYKMKGSPHKMGTIEGTSMHKASMAKLAASEIPTAKVDMSRTSGDGTIASAFGEVGKSYIPAGMDYSLETGFKTEGEGKKKKKGKKEKKKKYDPRGKHEMDPNQLKDRPIVTEEPKTEGSSEHHYFKGLDTRTNSYGLSPAKNKKEENKEKVKVTMSKDGSKITRTKGGKSVHLKLNPDWDSKKGSTATPKWIPAKK